MVYIMQLEKILAVYIIICDMVSHCTMNVQKKLKTEKELQLYLLPC